MANINRSLFSKIAFFATLLAFLVVILGAYTRLKDAGLGCPDWPGCYGQLVVPQTGDEMASAQKLYPNQPIEPSKAWAEMVHRYFAGTLVLLILILTVSSYYCRKVKDSPSIKIPLLLLGCIFFQAMLGMWTVTLKLHPLIVMGHLLGGMTIASLLWWFTLATSRRMVTLPSQPLKSLRPWVTAGVVIVFLQIFLGGWTSANYASIICPDFPYCQGQLFPRLNFIDAFNFFKPLGQNYQGGILDTTARVTLQMSHRYGAFVVFSYICLLGGYILFSRKTDALKNTMGMIFILLFTQVFLGIFNILTSLFLPIAVTHNAVALLLLIGMVTLLYQVKAPSRLQQTTFADSSRQLHGELLS